jgi:dephospho-CoA kinase
MPEGLPHHDLGLRVVGLLGGVASGKSLVAQQLVELGAGLLDGDRAGHEVLRQPEVEEAARKRWGEKVFGPDGHIHRSAVAAIVFGPPPAGPQELEFLEQITHPRIGQLLVKQASDLVAAGKQVAVLDAPVMLKAGWDQLCHLVVFVEVSPEIRLARAQRRGWSQAEFNAREAAQESLEVKRRRADVVIDNSGSPESTQSQVAALWHSLAD